MKNFALLFICQALVCTALFAQKKTEGHWGKKNFDVAYAAAASDDGGYIVTGLTQSGTDTTGDIIVIKTTSEGDTVWSLVYGGPMLEGGNSVMQLADGNYLVAGHTEDFGAIDCDAFIMKLDRNGKRLWFHVFGGLYDDISEGVAELPNGDLVISGITESYGNKDSSRRRHAYFIKTNSNGELIWSKYYAGKRAEYAYDIATVPGDGFLAVGWTTSYGNGEYDGWLLRLNNNGDTLWTRLYQKAGNSRYYKITHTQDNGYAIAGYTSVTATSRTQGLLIKLDAEGKQLWEKTYGDTLNGIAFQGIAELPNGNLMLSGISYANDAKGNAYVLTTDANGNKLSDEFCGGSNSYATCIVAQGNNGYMIAGAAAQYGDPLLDFYYMTIDNTVSNVSTITTLPARLFPNPVVNESSIILPNSHAGQFVQFEILNVTGEVVFKQENVAAKDLVIDHNKLGSGAYFFRISCKDGTMYKGRFVSE